MCSLAVVIHFELEHTRPMSGNLNWTLYLPPGEEPRHPARGASRPSVSCPSADRGRMGFQSCLARELHLPFLFKKVLTKGSAWTNSS